MAENGNELARVAIHENTVLVKRRRTQGVRGRTEGDEEQVAIGRQGGNVVVGAHARATETCQYALNCHVVWFVRSFFILFGHSRGILDLFTCSWISAFVSNGSPEVEMK